MPRASGSGPNFSSLAPHFGPLSKPNKLGLLPHFSPHILPNPQARAHSAARKRTKPLQRPQPAATHRPGTGLLRVAAQRSGPAAQPVSRAALLGRPTLSALRQAVQVAGRGAGARHRHSATADAALLIRGALLGSGPRPGPPHASGRDHQRPINAHGVQDPRGQGPVQLLRAPQRRPRRAGAAPDDSSGGERRAAAAEEQALQFSGGLLAVQCVLPAAGPG